MDNVDTRNLLDDLNLTKHEERLLRHVVGLYVPEPKGYWGRFFQVPLNALRPREALSALVIVVAVMAAMFYSARKWPLVDDLLETIVTPLVLFAIMIALIFGQDQSSRLIRKLYLALEKTKVPGQ